MAVVINDRTSKAMRQIRKLSNEGIIDFAGKVVDIAKTLTPRLTGNNSDNILTKAHEELNVSVFTSSGYGAYLELGTAHMPARPYFMPAIGKAIREFNDGGKWS